MTPSLPPGPLYVAAAASAAGPATDAAALLAGEPVALMARIRARADGGLVLWWWQGDVFGKRPGEITRRLLRISGVGFNRIRRQPDGLWESTMSEAGYYADADTGEILDAWTNPYTGREVRPEHNRLKLHYLIEPGGVIRPAMPGVPFEGRVGPAIVSGDTVWMSERLAASFPAAPPPKPGADPGPDGGKAPKGLIGEPMEVTHFVASVADVNDARLEVVPATMSHSTIWSFYPWLGMEPASGYVITEIIGRKVADEAAVPAALRARIDRDHPGLFGSPGI